MPLINAGSKNSQYEHVDKGQKSKMATSESGSLTAAIRIKINKEIRKQKKVEQTREWRRRVREIQKSSTTKEQTVKAATLRKRKQREKERIKREKIENSKRKEMERKSKLKEREEVKQRRKSLA
ncbi:ADP-ribosylation factor-like protein 6-interacting protein 4 [Saccostrea cucullata]|uniref:ADP-ribosylation factor-like protein 6-interacting protein 4 n=1 Tax=Saccostrea cuccullata TaxID=36930 RepID=UPI002ED0308E